MQNGKINIRPVTEADAAALVAVYAPYVIHTAVTFEYDTPTEEEFRRRIAAISSRFPYLVAENDEQKILGYAYANTFKDRPAYQWAVETTVYVDATYRRNGVGKRLYDALEEELRRRGIRNMNACIAFAAHPDPFLTNDSVRFHERMGFEKVAHFHTCGKKFGRWYDMIWMEKRLTIPDRQ